MAKLSAWLVTLIGVIWVLSSLQVLNSPVGTGWEAWIVGLAFLVMGVGKLMRNYGKRKR